MKLFSFCKKLATKVWKIICEPFFIFKIYVKLIESYLVLSYENRKKQIQILLLIVQIIADNLVTSRDDFDAFNKIKINSDDELVNKI